MPQHLNQDETMVWEYTHQWCVQFALALSYEHSWPIVTITLGVGAEYSDINFHAMCVRPDGKFVDIAGVWERDDPEMVQMFGVGFMVRRGDYTAHDRVPEYYVKARAYLRGFLRHDVVAGLTRESRRKTPSMQMETAL